MLRRSMKVEEKLEGDVAVATIAGDLDGKTAPELEALLAPIVEAHPKVVLVLRSVPYISSAGLRTLLSVYKQASAKKGIVALASLSKQTREVMRVTGLLGCFVVADSVEEAVAVIRARG
jgi:anti-sigma B factor antagonist